MKKTIYNLLKIIFISSIFYFLLDLLKSNWEKVEDYDFSFNYFYLFTSIILLVFNIYLRGYIWNIVLSVIAGRRVFGNMEAVRIITYSNLGKYLPGRLWGVLGAVYMSRDHDIPNKYIASSYLLQTALGLLSSVLAAVLLITFFIKQIEIGLILYLLVLLIIAFVIFPDIFYKTLNYIIRKLGKSDLVIENFPRTKDNLRIFSFLFLLRAINGLAFVFFVMSLVEVDISLIFFLACSYIIANVTALLAFFSPGGLGVKEGALAYLLSFNFDLIIATFLSIIARIWLVVADVASLVIFEIYLRFNKSKKSK